MLWQISATAALLFFYTVYIGKMLAQKKKGIQTDQMARGKKKNKVFYTELIMKIATYAAVAAEVISIVLNTAPFPFAPRLLGLILCLLGDLLFALAVWTMRDSWRAGIAQNDQTEMVTSGVYGFSRNPAFLAFDLMYAGVVLMFFNWALLAVSLLAGVMLHLQIVQEEKFLPHVFGESYAAYKNNVRRYFGKK